MSDRAVMRVVVATVLVATAFTPAAAQLVNGKWQAPSKSGGAAGAAPRTGVQTGTRAAKPTTSTGAATSAVPVRVIPAIVMSDGSIVADFGAGLEPVRRACPGSVADMPLRVVGGVTSTQPAPGLQAAPGMQAAPAQATASQQALPSAQVRAANQAARASCHLRDQRGRAFATR
jgi:hypothetical protein